MNVINVDDSKNKIDKKKEEKKKSNDKHAWTLHFTTQKLTYNVKYHFDQFDSYTTMKIVHLYLV